jgi:hypothetical protein
MTLPFQNGVPTAKYYIYLVISLNLEISTFVNNCSTSLTYNPIKSVHAFIWVNVFIFILRSIVILNGHLYYNLIMGV